MPSALSTMSVTYECPIDLYRAKKFVTTFSPLCYENSCEHIHLTKVGRGGGVGGKRPTQLDLQA